MRKRSVFFRASTALVALTAVALGASVPASTAHAASEPSPAPTPQEQVVTSEGVEEPSLTTATSVTSVDASGTATTDIYEFPINYQAPDGSWAPIDNTLEASTDSGYAWSNTAASYDLDIPNDLSQAPIRVSEGGDAVSFSLQGATGVGTAAGEEATFPGVAPATSLEYRAVNTGLKEEIILDSVSAPATFTFDLQTTPGLTAQTAADGGIDFVDDTGAPQFVIPAPYMYDSSGTDKGFSDAVTLSLGPDAATMTLSADQDWLSDSSRVWPITIDPTIQVQWYNAATDGTLDCHISESQTAPTATPLCSDTTVKVGKTSSSGSRRTLLYFDVSALPNYPTFTSASLGLWLSATGSTGNQQTIDAHRIRQTWDNAATWTKATSTTTWPGGGDIGTQIYDARQMDGANTSTVKTWQIKDLVAKWKNGTLNQGLLLKARDETVNNLLSFVSSDNATYSSVCNSDPTSTSCKWPRLSVQYPWEPFAFDTPSFASPWNARVDAAPVDTQYGPKIMSYITNMLDPSDRHIHLGGTGGENTAGSPIYFVTSDTAAYPTFTIPDPDHCSGTAQTWFENVPIPKYARMYGRNTTSKDKGFVIINTSTNEAWHVHASSVSYVVGTDPPEVDYICGTDDGYWHTDATFGSGAQSIQNNGLQYNVTGASYSSTCTGTWVTYPCRGHRGYAVPHMVTRWDELVLNGAVDHPMRLFLPTTGGCGLTVDLDPNDTSLNHVFPMASDEGCGSYSVAATPDNPTGLARDPEGARIRLKGSINCSAQPSLSSNPLLVAICRSWQTFGLVIADRTTTQGSGAHAATGLEHCAVEQIAYSTLCNAGGAQSSWNGEGVFADSMDALPLTSQYWEVVELGWTG